MTAPANTALMQQTAQGLARLGGGGALPESSGGRALPGGGTKRLRFELKGALSNGGSATAYVRRWNGTTWATTTTEITVHDHIGTYSGPAGTFGVATWWPDSGRFEIDDLGCT